MLPPYILSIHELSSFPGNMPMAIDISRAMQEAIRGVGARWIGAEPRIVRRTDATSFRGYETVVTWPVQFTDDYQLADRIEILANNVKESLRNSNSGLPSDWGQVYLRPYNEGVNGPLSFWTSGEASTSAQTRDMARWGAGRLTLPEEYPYGPNDLQARDPTPVETAEQLAERVREQVRRNLQTAADSLWYLVPVAVIGVGLWLAATTIPTLVKARKNPSRRRRARRIGPGPSSAR